MPKFGLEDLSVQFMTKVSELTYPPNLLEVLKVLETEEEIGKMALAVNCESVPETASLHPGSVQQPQP